MNLPIYREVKFSLFLRIDKCLFLVYFGIAIKQTFIMNSLKKMAVIPILSIVFFSFVKKDTNSSKLMSNLEDLKLIELLSKQKYECRPSSEFMFYVESNLIKKSRGANTISANIFVLDRHSGESKLLASENIFIPHYKGAISLKHDIVASDCEKLVLNNGDEILGSTIKAPYCFNELIQFESINRSYIKSKNKLLNLKSL
jgi:hypothetical protein